MQALPVMMPAVLAKGLATGLGMCLMLERANEDKAAPAGIVPLGRQLPQALINYLSSWPH